MLELLFKFYFSAKLHFIFPVSGKRQTLIHIFKWQPTNFPEINYIVQRKLLIRPEERFQTEVSAIHLQLVRSVVLLLLPY